MAKNCQGAALHCAKAIAGGTGFPSPSVLDVGKHLTGTKAESLHIGIPVDEARAKAVISGQSVLFARWTRPTSGPVQGCVE